MLFIQLLQDNPQVYFATVLTVIISIVFHELAHGFAALRVGDTTPIDTGHMTGNPLVHMPPMSFVLLFLVGIAWGAMPVDPTRMRGKYAGAFVAFAGPLTNLVLAFIALTGYVLWFKFSPDTFDAKTPLVSNLKTLLEVFGIMNLALFLFNLVPVPPLDGSRILADFSRGYRALLDNESFMGVMGAGFFILFLVGGTFIFAAARGIASWYLDLWL
jgi:Zn-dependent protease